jgi:hypothetical protein
VDVIFSLFFTNFRSRGSGTHGLKESQLLLLLQVEIPSNITHTLIYMAYAAHTRFTLLSGLRTKRLADEYSLCSKSHVTLVLF